MNEETRKILYRCNHCKGVGEPKLQRKIKVCKYCHSTGITLVIADHEEIPTWYSGEPAPQSHWMTLNQ